MQKNHRSGQATMTLQRPANLLQSSELKKIDTLFCQRTITGSSKGQWINREVIFQPVVVVQMIVRNFLKSFRWAAKCLLQTEENVARKKLLVVSSSSYIQYYRRKANTIILYRKMFTSEIDTQHVNWNFTKCIIFSELRKRLRSH